MLYTSLANIPNKEGVRPISEHCKFKNIFSKLLLGVNIGMNVCVHYSVLAL